MPKCSINGKEIEVAPGTNVIEAFKASGQEIAHYCYHPGLSVAGVCRLCMVDIEGNPRLQIACNTQVAEGMKISNQTPKVKESVKWVLDFHLINHPLDCPICDQAGECGLQDQYMKFGAYDPEMAESKVKKNKVVDLGPNVVLDSERCILCSRCVRFTDEVTKTGELGIFNRGDHSEIGTFDGRPLDNKYSVNTVDICPVGALTSKDFRFQQRAWYLENKKSVCPGCSTGCNVDVYYNDKGYFRIKPDYNKDVNGYWMCDEGRNMYKHINKDQRLIKAEDRSGSETKFFAPGQLAKDLSSLVKNNAASTAVVFTAQYTNEEYQKAIQNFKSLGANQFFYWSNNEAKHSEFDNLLLRGDRDPNTKGLKQALQAAGATASWSDLKSAIESGKITTIVVAGPEIQSLYTDIKEKADLFAKVKNVIWLSSNPSEAFAKAQYVIPMKCFTEKSGSFTNHAGLVQKTQAMKIVVSQALTLDQASALLCGQELGI